MKATELRVGNYVYYADKKTLLKINGGHILYPSQIYPIPITEDILLKCGFKDLGYGEFELGSYMCDGEYTDKDEWEFCYLGKRLCTVYFTHQLQNLYFALTGEELTIKL